VAPDVGGPDPLASLHKMSTTAGITSQEYVAINIPSILALVLGLATVLAALSPVLLLIPVAAICVALIALSQIRASNGTQTGRGFAWLGIILSLAIGGFVLARAGLEHAKTRADRDVIIRQIEQLGRHVAAGDYEKAYAMFSDRFQARVNRSTFDAVWDQSQKVSQLGRITSMQWNQTTIYFQDDPATGVRAATAYAWVGFEKSPEKARHPLVFRKAAGQWTIDDASQLFPSERRRPTPR
jgi:hypothetical protein